MGMAVMIGIEGGVVDLLDGFLPVVFLFPSSSQLMGLEEEGR